MTKIVESAIAPSQEQSLAERLLGTWTLVSHEIVHADGSRVQRYGPKPRGIAFFDTGGHFVITVMRPDRANYAIYDPVQGTAEENNATAQGTITYFGTYLVSEADQAIAIQIEGSSFPNWDGEDQSRGVAISGDQLMLTVLLTGRRVEVTWKRAK